jgi:hypothetical protein
MGSNVLEQRCSLYPGEPPVPTTRGSAQALASDVTNEAGAFCFERNSLAAAWDTGDLR